MSPRKKMQPRLKALSRRDIVAAVVEELAEMECRADVAENPWGVVAMSDLRAAILARIMEPDES